MNAPPLPLIFSGGSSYPKDSGVPACGSVVVKGTPMQVLQLFSDDIITAPEKSIPHVSHDTM